MAQHQLSDTTSSQDRFTPEHEQHIYAQLIAQEKWQEVAERLCHHGKRLIWSGYTSPLKELLEEVKRHGIQSPSLLLLYGHLFSMTGEWSAALQSFTSVFSSSEANPQARVEGWLRYGRLCFRKGEINEAKRAYQESYEYCVQQQYPQGEIQSVHALGYLDKISGDLQAAESKHTKALERAQAISDDDGVAYSLVHLGNVLRMRGDFHGALAKYGESLDIAKHIGDHETIAFVLEHVGLGYQGIGEMEKALATYEEGFQFRETLGDKRGMAVFLNRMGELWYAQRRQKLEQLASASQEEATKSIDTSPDFDQTLQEADEAVDTALKKHQESLNISREIGDKLGIATALNKIGFCLLQKENTHKHALPKLYEGLAIREEVGDTVGIGASLETIGFVYFYVGKWAQAINAYRKSLAIFEAIGHIKGLVNLHVNFGKLYHFTKEYRLAFKHLFIAQAMSNKTGVYIYNEAISGLIEFQRDNIKPKQYINIVHKAFDQLSEDLKPYINVEDFIPESMMKETTVRYETPKIGRNDPCPCGSGKKYKKCCGR